MTNYEKKWELLQNKLPLFNRAELCRRAKIPKSRLVDAERGRCKIRLDDLKKLLEVINE